MRKRLVVLMLTAAALATGALAAPAQADSEIVKLVNSQNGKCLQPKTLEEGEVIVQQTCNGTQVQQWLIEKVRYKKKWWQQSDIHLRNRASGFCMEVRDKAVNGGRVDQWRCGNISNEKWSFGIGNNLLSSGISTSPWSHCVASPGPQAGLTVELRSCQGGYNIFWRRVGG